MSRWATTTVLVLLFVGALAVAHRAGTAGRAYGESAPLLSGRPPAFLVRTPAEIYEVWKARGMHGRVVLHFTQRFGYRAAEINVKKLDIDKFPPSLGALTRQIESNLGGDRFMWIAARTGIIREIYDVASNPFVAPKLAKLRRKLNEPSIISVTQHAATIADRGLRRTLTFRIPELGEPVLVVFHASFFAGPGSSAVLKELNRPALRSDLIIFCLAVGDEKVTAAQRRQLMQLARRFGARRYAGR